LQIRSAFAITLDLDTLTSRAPACTHGGRSEHAFAPCAPRHILVALVRPLPKNCLCPLGRGLSSVGVDGLMTSQRNQRAPAVHCALVGQKKS
jgi:hypothetical protein